MTVLIVSSQHRSPKHQHLVPGAPPVSSQRLLTPAAHHAPALNRPVEYSSSRQSAIIAGFQPSAILKQTIPGNAADEPNPHSRPTAPAPAGSFFGGFRTLAPSGSTAHARPASETLHATGRSPGIK
jgi:hypothetical protein